MHITCWINKATNTHSQYVILIAFPRQQMLHECITVLLYTYIACLVFMTVHESAEDLCIWITAGGKCWESAVIWNRQRVCIGCYVADLWWSEGCVDGRHGSHLRSCGRTGHSLAVWVCRHCHHYNTQDTAWWEVFNVHFGQDIYISLY